MAKSKTKPRILIISSGIIRMDTIQEQRRKVMLIKKLAKT